MTYNTIELNENEIADIGQTENSLFRGEPSNDVDSRLVWYNFHSGLKMRHNIA